MRRRLLPAFALALLMGMTLTPSVGNADLAATHRHKAFVRQTVYEHFNVKATETYIRHAYWQNRTQVWGNYYDEGYCYHSVYPGWNTAQCYYWLGDNIPDAVRINIVGEYHHAFGIDYQDRAWARSRANNEFAYSCGFDHAFNFPPDWWMDCNGGRYKA